ncbi:gfo/Idh/MocA family oxidoreductase, partial [Thioclava sp. BHET1]
MTETVRWGILSAAKIARQWVAPAIHMSEQGEIAAIASRTPGKAEALARPYGEVLCLDSYDQLLLDPSIGALYIPLPNNDHVLGTEKA